MKKYLTILFSLLSINALTQDSSLYKYHFTRGGKQYITPSTGHFIGLGLDTDHSVIRHEVLILDYPQKAYQLPKQKKSHCKYKNPN